MIFFVYLVDLKVFFRGSSVKNYEWVKKQEDATALEEQDAKNLRSYFQDVHDATIALLPIKDANSPNPDSSSRE